jgi:hypothetical protein
MAPQLQQQVVFKKFDAAIQKLKASTTVEIADPKLAAQIKSESEGGQQPDDKSGSSGQ